MFMHDPSRRGVINFAAYLAAVAVLSVAVAWSAAEVGAALMRFTNGKIIDGSGKADPQAALEAAHPESTAVPAADSRPASEPTSARAYIPPTRVSSDDTSSGYESRNGFRDGFRTYCVRLCDGYYWPIGSSTPADKLGRDAARCQSSCDGPARLFVHRTSHGGPGTMVSLEGVPYVSLKTAFQFRAKYDEQCRCKPQPWSEASTDQHKLYAASAAAKKGDRTAAAEVKRLTAKVDAERADVHAARDKANVQASRQLAAVSTETDLPRRGNRRPFGDAMGLGMQQPQEAQEPQRRGGFVPASGSGRAWTDRVFGGN